MKKYLLIIAVILLAVVLGPIFATVIYVATVIVCIAMIWSILWLVQAFRNQGK